MNEATAKIDAARPLDEVMLAMDVVDTLRHRDAFIERELASGDRDRKLIERLRDIYARQGIEVSDDILEEGVKALNEERFVYHPPMPGLSVMLARLYINRGRFGKWLLGLVVACLLVWGSWQALVVWPRERATEAARIEVSETLPKQLANTRQAIIDVAQTPEAADKAEAFFADGANALKRGDVAAAREATAKLAELDKTLNQQYRLRIVQDANELSGVWRIPDRNRNAQNYYLIVEAIDDRGNAVALPVLSEESNKMSTVKRFGLRVSEGTFERVRDDKSDDGIIQDNIVAVKERGYLQLTYRLPVVGGAITEW